MSNSHDELVTSQFGPRAQAYVESAVHATGEDLQALEAIVQVAAPVHALDLGCGGGHVAYAMAQHAEHVTAADLSSEMLAAVAATARTRGLANIETRSASVEHLPFANGGFDFVATRFSAHHWRDLERGLREARRVLKSGSPAIFIDVCGPIAAPLDTHLQAIELLRDPSHVRDYTLTEWTAALARAGFQVRACRTRPLRLDFQRWILRMRTPDINAQSIRALQTIASDMTRRHFAIEPDGSFTTDVLMLETVAA